VIDTPANRINNPINAADYVWIRAADGREGSLRVGTRHLADIRESTLYDSNTTIKNRVMRITPLCVLMGAIKERRDLQVLLTVAPNQRAGSYR